MELGQLLAKYPRGERGAVIPLLQAVQDAYGYVPPEAADEIAEFADVAVGEIFGVASFYSQFRFTKPGEHHIKVCSGTACHVRGSAVTLDLLERQLKIKQGETTEDEQYSLERVACFGCCALAPVVVVDDDVHSRVRSTKVPKLLTRYKGKRRKQSVPDDGSTEDGSTDNGATQESDVADGAPLKVTRTSKGRESGRLLSVCMGTGCMSAKGAELHRALKKEIDERNLADRVEVRRTGCFGFCEQGPLVVAGPAGTFYTKVKPGDVGEIVEEDVLADRPVERLLYRDPNTNEVAVTAADIGFYKKQHRVVLGNVGVIDPENIQHYLDRDGYGALRHALTEMTPESVIRTVTDAGLRGRGGAGFATGLKWKFARDADGDAKYVICNADEGDPGAFMNCALLEGDPHAMLEGLTLAGYAVGAKQGFIYLRAEYPLAVKRVRKALADSQARGMLGRAIFDTDFDFEIEVRLGAGAFVCGEETALMQSIEGRRGMPRPRPPYPVQKGLWGQPTTINNVETLATVPLVIRRGPDWYAGIGVPNNAGTKTFSLTGKVHNTGLVEAPLGTTLRELIFDIGGGIIDGREFKMVQTGGPSGGCIPASMLDTPIDYESLKKAGSIMGSGGIVVMDDRNCAVDIAHYFLSFTQAESCGECPPCRVGTQRMLEIVSRIKAGRAKLEDIDRLEILASTTQNASLCGLGQTAPNPVLTTLRHFREEYLTHINERRCPAGVCQDLITFEINQECNGCTVCARVCPSDAIAGAKKEMHSINTSLCVRCGACLDACKFDAVDVN